MSPTVDAFLLSWSFDPWVVVPLLLAAAIYVRGFCGLRRGGSHYWHLHHLVAFLAGLAALGLALASPLDAFAALGALFLYAFDPTIIAHSALVTTDTGVTAFTVLFLFTLWRYLQRPDWKRLAISGVALGAGTGRHPLTWSAQSATTHVEHAYDDKTGRHEPTGQVTAAASLTATAGSSTISISGLGLAAAGSCSSRRSCRSGVVVASCIACTCSLRVRLTWSRCGRPRAIAACCRRISHAKVSSARRSRSRFTKRR